jgi:hypothetical protein
MIGCRENKFEFDPGELKASLLNATPAAQENKPIPNNNPTWLIDLKQMLNIKKILSRTHQICKPQVVVSRCLQSRQKADCNRAWGIPTAKLFSAFLLPRKTIFVKV